MLQTIQSTILVFKPPNISNKKTKQQIIQTARGIKDKELDDQGN